MGNYQRKTDIVFRRLTPEKKVLLEQMWAADKTMGEIARTLDVEGATVRRYLKNKGYKETSRYQRKAKRAQITEMLLAGKSPTEVAELLQVWPNYVVRELRLLIAEGKTPPNRFYQTEFKCGTCGKRVLSPVYGVYHPTGELEIKDRFCSKGCAVQTKKRFTGARISVTLRSLIG